MKHGFCKNHPKIYAQNSRGLCGECTREKHRQSAESKGFTIKEKRNDNNGIQKQKWRTIPSGLAENATPVSFAKTNSKIKHRSEKGKEIVKAELLLFQKIFNERPPKCEWCGTSIKVFNPCNYHHVRTKGSHPELRLVESNIVKICVECHLKEHSFRPRLK